MANVTRYEVLIYGDSNGYMGLRAQLSLFDGLTHLGYIRFVDVGVAISNDSNVGGNILMHQSITMFDYIIGVLRNNTSPSFYFAGTHAFLAASGTCII